MSVEVLVEVAARSDVGCVREANEDAWLVADLTAGTRGVLAEVERHRLGARGSLFAVADGMGGAAAGEVASALAADVLHGEMAAAAESGGDKAVMARLLRRAIRAANQRVHDESRKVRARRGMGTTLSAAFAHSDTLVLGQVGDSRAYLYRGETLVQLTRDQSVVSALVQAGRLSADEARTFAGSNVILQALGVDTDVEVSLSLAELRRGDVLVLCSDGLSGPLGDEGIRAQLVQHADLGVCAAELIAAAKTAGGPDNITVVLVRFVGDGLGEPTSPEDLPHFVEFDPAEEGERGLTTTSRVARRLAAKAGMADEASAARSLPPTGQHPAITQVQEASRRGRRKSKSRPVVGEADGGPAADRLRQASRLSPLQVLIWLGLGALVATLVFRCL